MRYFIQIGFVSLMVCLSLSAYAAKLTQAEYDQFIEVQTSIVNETKPILDEANPEVDAKAQRDAFCARLIAYENIKTTSEENSELHMAAMMKIVADSFLSRQHESLTKSGMTTQVFCSHLKQNNIIDNKE